MINSLQVNIFDNMEVKRVNGNLPKTFNRRQGD